MATRTKPCEMLSKRPIHQLKQQPGFRDFGILATGEVGQPIDGQTIYGCRDISPRQCQNTEKVTTQGFQHVEKLLNLP